MLLDPTADAYCPEAVLVYPIAAPYCPARDTVLLYPKAEPLGPKTLFDLPTEEASEEEAVLPTPRAEEFPLGTIFERPIAVDPAPEILFTLPKA